jgi:hypothetical protein
VQEAQDGQFSFFAQEKSLAALGRILGDESLLWARGQKRYFFRGQVFVYLKTKREKKEKEVEKGECVWCGGFLRWTRRECWSETLVGQTLLRLLQGTSRLRIDHECDLSAPEILRLKKDTRVQTRAIFASCFYCITK